MLLLRHFPHLACIASIDLNAIIAPALGSLAASGLTENLHIRLQH